MTRAVREEMLKVVLKALYSTLLKMVFNTGNKRPVHNVPYISESICRFCVFFLFAQRDASSGA